MKTPSFRLDGKNALVTGASSGIGQACAVALGEYGAHVTIAARRVEALRETARLIKNVEGKSTLLPLDVTNIGLMESTVSQRGPFDILVNAAGMARHALAVNTKESDFDEVDLLNFKAAFFVTRTVAKGLLAVGKPGSLINISSQMGHVGGVDRSVYAATKHAIEGMTKSMAIEWGSMGIRVNTISPTFISTALTAKTFEDPERRNWINSKIKLGRVGVVEDIMGGVIYLASDASALVTGTTLMIDGGWTAE